MVATTPWPATGGYRVRQWLHARRRPMPAYAGAREAAARARRRRRRGVWGPARGSAATTGEGEHWCGSASRQWWRRAGRSEWSQPLLAEDGSGGGFNVALAERAGGGGRYVRRVAPTAASTWRWRSACAASRRRRAMEAKVTPCGDARQQGRWPCAQPGARKTASCGGAIHPPAPSSLLRAVVAGRRRIRVRATAGAGGEAACGRLSAREGKPHAGGGLQAAVAFGASGTSSSLPPQRWRPRSARRSWWCDHRCR